MVWLSYSAVVTIGFQPARLGIRVVCKQRRGILGSCVLLKVLPHLDNQLLAELPRVVLLGLGTFDELSPEGVSLGHRRLALEGESGTLALPSSLSCSGSQVRSLAPPCPSSTTC